MIRHGFPLQGLKFEWDEAINYTPEQQLQIEKMIVDNYEVDPSYFVDKYNIKILKKKEKTVDAGSFFK